MRATPNERIAEMNIAFGNPKGDPKNIDLKRIHRQCMNIIDECTELMGAIQAHNLNEIRDALCDIQVFASGAQHLMGVDADADMHAVIDGVMTRFIKNDLDKDDTITIHARKGVTEVYFEGEYPKMIMKSGCDQPDAPKGKFLKSASYTNTVFPVI